MARSSSCPLRRRPRPRCAGLARHALIALEAGEPALGILERLTALAPHEERMNPYQRGLVHDVSARCHAQAGQVIDARRELDLAEAAWRCAWLDGRLAPLRERLHKDDSRPGVSAKYRPPQIATKGIGR